MTCGGCTVGRKGVRAAGEGGRRCSARVCTWLGPGFCLIPRGALECESHHRVGPTLGQGFGILYCSGLASNCLVCGCDFPGQGAVIVPRAFLWKPAAVSPQKPTHSIWRLVHSPEAWPSHRECPLQGFSDPSLPRIKSATPDATMTG